MSKKRVYYLFIAFVFFSVFRVSAQNIQKEKQPLALVLIWIEEHYKIYFSYVDILIEDKKATLPEENLELEKILKQLQSETNLDFIAIDKNSIVISPRNNPLSSIITQKLEEIVINNYLTTGISKKSDGKITFQTEKFGILPGLIEPDILQTIQALPGIMSVDETVSNINIRGGTHDENLILWDGIKMYQSGHFFGLVSAFNPYLTKKVNVSKNGSSVKFGDGISGVIDMQQSNEIDQDFKAGVGFNLISSDGFAKIPLNKKTELQVSARRSITDFIITPTYDQYFKRAFQDSDLSNTNSDATISNNENFYFYDVSAKLLYDITDSDQLRFNFLTINNNLSYDKKSIQSNDTPSKSSLEQDNLALGAEYLKYWNNKITTTAQLYLSTYNLNTTNYDVINNQRLNQENAVSDFGIKINATNHIDDHLKLHGGYQFTGVIVKNTEDVMNPNIINYAKNINRSHAIYGEAEFTSANKNTYARIGIRTNYIEKFSEVFTEPRLAVSHKLNNKFRLEILAEFKHQTMSQIIDLQDDFLGIEKRRWVISDDNTVPIIQSKQGSVGIHYNKNNFLISAEAFLKHVDGINSRSQGFQNQYQFTDVAGAYQVKGVDFLVHKQFKNTSAWLSYSFSNNDYNFKDLNDGNTFASNLDVKHTVTFASTYQISDFKLALGLNWHSGKPTTTISDTQNTTNTTIEYNAPNANNLSDYLRADLSATYHFKFSKTANAMFGFSIWNLTNRANIINTYYTLDDDNEIHTIENKSLGITPNVSFRVHF
ncbi:TonB-dependent receptor plug domain-containing protein [Lacinutrix undariae]